MIRKFTARFCLLFIIIHLLPTAASSAELETWNGKLHVGSIEFSRGTFSVEHKNKITRKTIDDVFEIRFEPEPADTEALQRLTLTDGSTFTGEIGVSANFEELPITLASGKKITISGSMIQDIEFANLDTGASVTGSPPGPHCISRNGKTILCDIEWISYRDISIKTRAGRYKLDRDKIHKVGFARKASDPISRSNVRVRTRYNDNIITRLVHIDKGMVHIDHVVGRLTYKISDLLSIESLSDNVKPLTDLQPVKTKHTPYLDYIKTSKINRNLFGGSIILKNLLFEKGIAMHSRTAMQFNLGGQYRLLVTYAGLDNTVTDMGNAIFIIKGDGKTLEQHQISGTDDTRFIRIDVSNVQNLSIVVDYGENGSSGDHAIWGNPRLIK